MRNLIQLTNVKKTYDTGTEHVHALNDISFEVSEGEFVAIMGPSGSGKSTLLSLLGGLNHPTEGTIVVDDIDVYSLPVERLADFRREYLGFVFQSFQLISYLTIIENIMLPLAVSTMSRAEKRRTATEIIDRVGLSTKALRLPGELSGGEQQRVAIARALVNQPPIVLADEPTGNLDSATSQEIMELLASFNAEGHTVVMVTHNPENLRYVHRCIRLRDGRVQEEPTSPSANVVALSSDERFSDHVC